MRQVFIVVLVFVFTFAVGFCASRGRALEPTAMFTGGGVGFTRHPAQTLILSCRTCQFSQ